MLDKDKLKSYWTSWGNGNTTVVPKIIEMCPEMIPMLETPQSRSNHAEGSVARHTILTCEAINDVIESVPQSFRRILRFASLLHDVGKPHCIIEAAPGIYSFPKANEISSRLARIILDNYAQVSIKEREHIVALIYNHPKPLQLIKKGMLERDLQKMSLECNLEILYFLVQANYVGREAPNLRQRLEELENFKMWALNSSLWGGKTWKGLLTNNDVRRFGKNANIVKSVVDWFYLTGVIENHIQAQDMFIPKNKWCWGSLYFTVGPPGSGKSTWVKKNYPMVTRVSSDEIRVELCGNMVDQSRNSEVYDIAEERLRHYLSEGKQVVFDTTNLKFEKRKRMIDLARSLGAHVVCLFFTTTYENCILRVKHRPELSLAKEIVDEMYAEFDYTSAYEYDKIIYV